MLIIGVVRGGVRLVLEFATEQICRVILDGEDKIIKVDEVTLRGQSTCGVNSCFAVKGYCEGTLGDGALMDKDRHVTECPDYAGKFTVVSGAVIRGSCHPVDPVEPF